MPIARFPKDPGVIKSSMTYHVGTLREQTDTSENITFPNSVAGDNIFVTGFEGN